MSFTSLSYPLSRAYHRVIHRAILQALALLLALCSSQWARSGPLLDSMVAPWRLFVVVSTTLPRSTLVKLASEASKAHAVMVLNGFQSGQEGNLQYTQFFVQELIYECCKSTGLQFIINPLLIFRYKIKSSPSFVIAKGDSDNPADFSVVAGDMSLANALKFFAQDSSLPRIREEARLVYQRTYAERL